MIKEWVRVARERGASDILLEAGTPLVLRIRGELFSVGEPIAGDYLLQTTKDLLDPGQWQEFLERRSYDLSRTLSGARCRLNVFQSVRGVCIAIRLLSSFQNSISDSNLHPELRRFVEAKTGLLIISGPTGSGKSTTLAALLEEINITQRRHIIAIESPIEYFFPNKKSFIRQREVPTHTPSFEQAIVDAMRENPDILVIGEMRTPEVMRLTLSAAETGHLVLATMHSSTCAEAVGRICMSFPAEMQGSIRTQLADSLVGVVCQRLTYLPQFQLRVPHCEIMVANSPVKSHIRSGQLSQIVSAIQTGGEEGMWSFDRYQRWMDQKKDWVKPSQARPMAAEDRADAEPSSLPSGLAGSAGAQLPPRSAAPRPAAIPAQRPRLASPSSPARSPTRAPSRGGPQDHEEEQPPAGGGRIEISAPEEDLEELARKIADGGEEG